MSSHRFTTAASHGLKYLNADTRTFFFQQALGGNTTWVLTSGQNCRFTTHESTYSPCPGPSAYAGKYCLIVHVPSRTTMAIAVAMSSSFLKSRHWLASNTPNPLFIYVVYIYAQHWPSCTFHTSTRATMHSLSGC
jgi:hypothetical protein